jgi:ectoine hydroxylase-related dioxygenase (phytanoyl-CoA dioxygenase family)
MNDPQAVHVYGVSERLSQNDAIDEAVAELCINGFTVLPSGFSPAFIDSLKNGLDRAYAKQVAEIGSEADLQAINDADIARCMLTYEADYLDVATAPALIALAQRYLGSEFVLMMQNGIINRPDRENYQARWHRDLNYQHWTSSKPVALNALLCIDEFTAENGATFVLPGTHRVAPFPTDAFTRKHQMQLSAPAGSFVVLDAMVFHRAGINRSSKVRRAVNHVIGLPFMTQQVDIPRAMARGDRPEPADPQVRKYLGYRWTPAADAIDWRQRRLVR